MSRRRVWSDTVYLTPEEWGATRYLVDEKNAEAFAADIRECGEDFVDCSISDLREIGQILRGKEARAIRRKLEIPGRGMIAVFATHEKRGSGYVRLCDCYSVTHTADPAYLGSVEAL